MRTSGLLAVLVLSLSAPLATADEPLPPPNVVPEPPPIFINPQWGRVGRYAAWQDYGVDRYGRWRPRVIFTPDGPFYYYNGRPFPWMTVHPLEFMPYATD